MQRRNWRLNTWLYRQPLWRYLLAYFVMALAGTYAIFRLGDFITNQILHWHIPPWSPLHYLAFAVMITVVGLIGRRIERRWLGLAERQRP